MHILNPNCNVDSFFTRLTNGEQAVLLLDYDGTLAPFTAERDRAYPYPGVRERLNRIQSSSETRLVIVSGRRSQEVIRLLGLDRIPEIWGQHGAERRLPDGSIQTLKLPDLAIKGLAEAEIWVEKNGLAPICELKPTSLAFHWRALSESETSQIHSKVSAKWGKASHNYGLLLRDFDGGLELKVAGIDKGRAVRQILGELTGKAVVAYLGDDYTDEDAFNALAGNGLRVLVRPEARPTAADIWLQPPEELMGFIDRWLTATA